MLFALIDISHLIKRADYSEKIVKIERRYLAIINILLLMILINFCV